MNQSPSIAALAKALVKAQAALQPAVKDATNPFFKSSYADLSSVWDACRDALTANGLSVSQFPGFEMGNPPCATLTTVLLHESGEWIAGTAGAPLPGERRKDGTVDPPNAQAVGSAITYLRRYGLAAVVGVVQADDDGNAASRPKQTKPRPEQQPLNEKPAALAKPDVPAPWDGTPSWKGKPLKDFISDDLVKLRAFCIKKDPAKYAKLCDQIDTELAGRQGE